MQFLLDNLSAVVVGTVLLGILAVVARDQQTESVTLAEHHASAGRAAALSDWLLSDMQSLTAVTSRTDSTLAFSRTADAATLTTTQVEYRRVRQAGTPARYRVVRREGGVDRTVGPAVSEWTATLLTATGQATTTATAAKAVRVRVVTAAGYTEGAAPAAAVWERTFSPRMLGGTSV